MDKNQTIEKYVIETKDAKFITLSSQGRNSLYAWHSNTPVLNTCWLDSMEEVTDLINAMTDNENLFKENKIYGLTVEAIQPYRVKKIQVSYTLEDVN